MTSKTQVAAAARNLMLSEYQGVLSTHSLDAPGYPFGSVAPYCLDRKGRPMILISAIAQHTKNINANPKVSLIVMERDADDSQEHGRVTYLGEARPLPPEDEDAPSRYYRFFPEARDYHKTHDFDFYRLELHRARFIGGFGRIHWVERDDFLRDNPFDGEAETRAIEHMNKDHGDALKRYCRWGDIPLNDAAAPVMAGIDGEGFHLRLGKRLHRLGFDEPVATMPALRQKLMEMARRD